MKTKCLFIHLVSFDPTSYIMTEKQWLKFFSVVASFEQTSYTVTEGKDEFVEVTLVRTGDLSRNTTVTLTTFAASALGELHT